jgi:hypothetical protein
MRAVNKPRDLDQFVISHAARHDYLSPPGKPVQ